MPYLSLLCVCLTLIAESLPASAAASQESPRALYTRLCIEHGAEKAITESALKYSPNITDICGHEAEDAFPEQGTSGQCHPLNLASIQAMCQQMLEDTGKAATFCPSFATEIVQDSTLLSGEISESCTGSSFLVLTEACTRLANERTGTSQESGVCVFSEQGDRPLLSPLQTKDAVNNASLQQMRAHLPPGIPIAKMIAELTANGFKCSSAGAEGTCKGSQTALSFTRRRFGTLATLDWTLRWNATLDGKLERLTVALFPMHL